MTRIAALLMVPLFIAPAGHRALMYAGGPNVNDVDVYAASRDNPPPRQHIKNSLDAPTGIALDASGDVYICNNAGQSVPGKGVYWTVTVYKDDATKPYREFIDGVFSPVDVAVASDGTVYIANYSSAVTVYPPGTSHYYGTLDEPNGFAPIGVALDRHGNVYVSYVPRSGSGGVIYRYRPGAVHGKNIDIQFSNSPHGLAFDNAGDLIVAVSNAPSSGSEIEIFAPHSKMPKQVLTGPFQPFMLALSPNQQRLYVADYGSGNNDGGVWVFSYPSGSLLYKDTNGAAAGAYGVAVGR
jgi:DNA-binding beta-propeller fold protein YncE